MQLHPGKTSSDTSKLRNQHGERLADGNTFWINPIYTDLIIAGEFSADSAPVILTDDLQAVNTWHMHYGL